MEDKQILEHHINSYKKAIIESINNNTYALVDEDLMSLIRKPPLDSMDSIKMQLLSLAKKNSIILNTEELDNVIENYRQLLEKECQKIKNIRINELNKIVTNTKVDKDQLIKLNKKDFISINKETKKIVKESLKVSFEELMDKLNKIFDNVDNTLLEKIEVEMKKYLKNSYEKQLLENIDIKILVKDTTLINIVKENSERFVFSINNSKLIKNEDFES